MPDAPALLAFMAAGLLLNLMPGPDVFFILSQATRHGVRAGCVAALGISAGCCVHIVAAALGVSALVATSVMAFTLLKWAGAAYLVYVGVGLLFSRRGMSQSLPQSDESAPVSLWGVVGRGFGTNVLNPKVASFFLAFVPQFIAPDAAHPSWTFLLLGLLFNFNALWVNFGWALATVWLTRRVGVVRRSLRWVERAAGVVFVGLGVQLTLADAPSPVRF